MESHYVAVCADLQSQTLVFGVQRGTWGSLQAPETRPTDRRAQVSSTNRGQTSSNSLRCVPSARSESPADRTLRGRKTRRIVAAVDQLANVAPMEVEFE